MADVLCFDLDQRLPGGFRFPARMSAIPTRAGTALVSPIPLDDAIVSALGGLPEVRFLIAPNALHHLYLGPASERFPDATVLAPRALRAKRPDLRIDRDLEDGLPQDLASEITAVPFDGAPALAETAFFHADSRTLVVTDLVFNVVRPQGFVAHVVLTLVGCHGRLAQSRALRFGMVKDRVAAKRSAEALLALPFERLVMAHGDVVERGGRGALASALAWLGPDPRAIAATSAGP